jgi:hypothetical protein
MYEIGAGIILAQKWEQVKRITEGGQGTRNASGGNKQFIAQLYIANPLLLDGYKFDFRCIPLNIHLTNDG